ncbi:MAG: ABC transporter permease [Eubacteriales bacterium]|nr:ABC transporter permease [Eubacteriales bacterium]
MIDKLFTYIQENYSAIGEQIVTHLTVSLLALLVAVLIGVPLGYLASKKISSERLISIPFQILRVVPSLAILVLLIPIMGTGTAPAVAALAVLAIPPVLLNTIVGFREVPDFMIESGVGIGMTQKQVLKDIRIPLAMPMILAGIRTGLVEAVASATLAAKIGAGGLGEIIFTGLGLNRTDLLLIGGIAVAILSLGCGLLFDLMTRWILKYKYV